MIGLQHQAQMTAFVKPQRRIPHRRERPEWAVLGTLKSALSAQSCRWCRKLRRSAIRYLDREVLVVLLAVLFFQEVIEPGFCSLSYR